RAGVRASSWVSGMVGRRGMRAARARPAPKLGRGGPACKRAAPWRADERDRLPGPPAVHDVRAAAPRTEHEHPVADVGDVVPRRDRSEVQDLVAARAARALEGAHLALDPAPLLR